MYGKTDEQKDRVCSNISLLSLYPLLIKSSGEYHANLLRLHVLCTFVCLFAGINTFNITHVEKTRPSLEQIRLVAAKIN